MTVAVLVLWAIATAAAVYVATRPESVRRPALVY
jgi:hypothetical protein